MEEPVKPLTTGACGTAGASDAGRASKNARAAWAVAIIVALNDIGYRGPLSVEWEDIRMDRVHGATESAAFVRRLDFAPSAVAFDAAFDKKTQ